MTAASRISSIRRAGIRLWLPALLFVLTVIITAFVTWNTSLYALDGDASSELVLAHHINEIGKPLSSQWYYSSELRVLNTQLIFAPLFSVFSDWHMVRFVGTLILQALMVLSFFYLGKEIRLSWGARFLGGSLLLLPVSVTYGRFVLYQAYYIPHIAIGFAIIALYLSAMRRLCGKQWLPAFVRFALLCLLSLLSGLGGVRQGVVTHIPLLLLLLVFLFMEAKDKPLLAAMKEQAPGLTVALAAAAAFGLGYIVNSRYLSSAFVFRDYNGLTINLVEAEELPGMLFGLLHFFGFREETRAISLLGVLSLGAVFCCMSCAAWGVSLLKDRQRVSPAHMFAALLALCATCVMLGVYLLLDNGWYHALYLLPAMIWFIPLIASAYDAMPGRIGMLGRADACMLLSIVLLIANGLVNAAFFGSLGSLFPQRYHGIGYENMTLGKQLQEPVQFLKENGYTFGFAEFWTANAITEVSDGSVKAANILINCYDRPMVQYEHLTLHSIFDTEADKAFLMLTSYHNRAYAAVPYEDKGELVYDDGEYVIYHFDDPSVIRKYVSWEYELPR